MMNHSMMWTFMFNFHACCFLPKNLEKGNAFIMGGQSVDSIYELNLVTENSRTEVASR